MATETRRGCRRSLLVAAAVVAAGCNTEAPSAPVLEERVVVHAVLDPRNAEQVILVERTSDSAELPAPASSRATTPVRRSTMAARSSAGDSTTTASA